MCARVEGLIFTTVHLRTDSLCSFVVEMTEKITDLK